MTPSESLKNTWAAIFQRRGGNGTYTRLFDKLDPRQQGILLAEFSPTETELAVVGSVQDSANWFVLTTERLAWSIRGERSEIPVSIIHNAMPGSNQRKEEMRQLRMETTVGDCLIELEPGAPLTGVWNILNNLGARNRKAIAELLRP